ncbi:MAG: MBL fold metallo-hydrolase [Candidatus Spechtbacterales bacterium]
MAKLTFHGGALSVTGANYLIETQKTKVLVDCGMMQGSRHAEEENYKSFPYDPSKVDAVFITHAHIDHTGRLPKLIKDGFAGPVYATEPTVELANVMLQDSQGLIEHEAEGKHPPLYGKKDVEKTKTQFKPVKYRQEIRVNEDIRVRFRDAGHILGSAIIELWVRENGKPFGDAQGKETKFVFSGDLGNPPTPLLNPTEFIDEADYVLVETTYGDRLHEDKAERKGILENVIEDTVTAGGTLMVPSFALERTQEMLFELNNLVENNRIPKVPVFIDSPLAIRATAVYKKHSKYFNRKAMGLVKKGDRLFEFPNLSFTMSVAESKAINEVPPPKVIIAGSGMSTGGRILHHELRYLQDPASTILFIGYQARGTLGRRIRDGAKSVKIYGTEVPVKCHIRSIGGYSAHADQEGLYEWIDVMRQGGKLKKVFCVQGEEEAANAFSVRVRDNMAVDAVVPKQGDVFEF